MREQLREANKDMAIANFVSWSSEGVWEAHTVEVVATLRQGMGSGRLVFIGERESKQGEFLRIVEEALQWVKRHQARLARHFGNFFIDFNTLISKRRNQAVDVMVAIQPGCLDSQCMAAVVVALVSVATGRVIKSEAALFTGMFDPAVPPHEAMVSAPDIRDEHEVPHTLVNLL